MRRSICERTVRRVGGVVCGGYGSVCCVMGVVYGGKGRIDPIDLLAREELAAVVGEAAANVVLRM